MPYGHLEELLKQSLEVAKENHKILKRMERNALIGFIVKVIVWLIVLGVPILFFSAYIGPLISAVQNGTAGNSAAGHVWGIPSPEQIRQLIEAYKGQK